MLKALRFNTSDSHYANFPATSHSIGGYCFSFGLGMVLWVSCKQPHIANSFCYAALYGASYEVLFVQQLLDGLHLALFDPVFLYCNNDTTCQLTEDQWLHACIWYFHANYNTTQDLVSFEELQVLHVHSYNNTADILTKSLM